MVILSPELFKSLADASLSVLDTEGSPVPLERLWAERPVVLGFVRHFG